MTHESRPPQASDKDLEHELDVAERRGAERLRAQVRDVLDDRRRIVRLGDQQIEVVEVSAFTDLLDEESYRPEP